MTFGLFKSLNGTPVLNELIYRFRVSLYLFVMEKEEMDFETRGIREVGYTGDDRRRGASGMGIWSDGSVGSTVM